MAVRGSGAVLAMALMAGIGAAPAAAQDVDAGQKVYASQCRICHTVDKAGRNGVGPNLYGVFDRTAAAEGFRYSAPMREKAAAGLAWSEDQLRAYVREPKVVVPGGSMAYVGLRNDQQLNDLVAYLKQATRPAP